MVKASEFSVGLMQKMALSFAKNGFTPEELNRLCENPQKIIRTIDVFRGYGHVTKRQWCYCPTLDAMPVLPHGDSQKPVEFTIISEVSMERDRYIFTRHADGLYVDGERIELHEAAPSQPATAESKAWYDYAHVYEELYSVSNAGGGLAKFLLRYPKLIPEEWFPEECFGYRNIIFPGMLVCNKVDRYPYGGSNAFTIRLYRDEHGKSSVYLALVAAGGAYGEGLSRPSAIILK